MSEFPSSKPSGAAIAKARELVEQIASDYGWISPEGRAKTSTKVLEALENAENTHTASAQRLLEKLDKSKANFVMELIQYTVLSTSVNFTVTPTQIKITSKEDGFTAEDVKAICSIGKRTRGRGEFPYSLDDEGIGFKSVFRVASRARIQSGPYSFFFEYNVGETGMGLITPQVCEPEVWEDDGDTIITLTLRKDVELETILKHFEDVPKVSLLFIKKLNELSVEGPLKSEFQCLYNIDKPGRQAVITISNLRAPESFSKYYHITTRKLKDLAHDSRTGRDDVEILLAFPLSSDEMPLIEEQDIYALYSLGKFGFPFLIQSDFLENDDGKLDIGNPRNQEIFDGVAATFVDAVLQMCQHPTLQYRWIRYLPEKTAGPLASQIVSKIEHLLTQTPILRSRIQGPLRKVSELKIVSKSFRNLDGEPLLEDCPEDIYLDTSYLTEDTTRLMPLGLKYVSCDDIFERIKQDIGSANSKYKSSETTSHWHAQIADIMNTFGAPKMRELEKLDLIPLQNGAHTHSLGKLIFFSKDGQIQVPEDLDLHIVDPRAISDNPSREALFRRLGVISIDTDTVRDRILERYESEAYLQWRSTLTVERSVCHLKYLYLTRKQVSDDASTSGDFSEEEQEVEAPITPTYSMIRLFDQNSALVSRHWELYFPTEDEFGIQRLARGKFHVSFINEAYFTTEPRTHTPGDITWKDWLHDHFGVLYCPRLSHSSRPIELSHTVRHIANNQPESFLGFIQTHWVRFSTQLNPGLVTTVADVEVPCKDDKLQPLHFTYLPSLENCAQQYLRGEQFPFLKLPCSLAADDWGFLASFGVGISADLDFHLQVLSCIRDAAMPSRTLEETGIKDPERVLQLYEAIQTDFANSQEPEHDKAKIQSFLEETRAIIVPYQPNRSTWLSPSECVWDGPDSPLKVVLSSCKLISGNPILVDFFQNTIEVPNVDWIELIDILLWNKDHPEQINAGDISAIYERLQVLIMYCDYQDVAEISEFFNEYHLVYIPAQKSWIAPEQCSWGSAAHVGGKINIDATYPSLQDLFVDFLDVEQFSLEEVVNKLARLWRTKPAIHRIKMLIWSINSSSPTLEDLQCLRTSKIFPVRTINGVVELFSWDDEFVVADRQDLVNAFEGQLNMLDFTLEEVHRLRWFISGLDLHHRYISHLISEKTEFLGGFPSLNFPMTNLLRHRAHALFRCACHFESPWILHNYHDLYNVLLQAQVLETDGIATYLSISHRGREVTVRSSHSGLFIDESTFSLRLISPSNPQQGSSFYYRALPIKIFRYIMSERSLNTQKLTFPTELVRNAVAVITDILCVDDSMIDDILTTAGIIQVPFQEMIRDAQQDGLKLWEDSRSSRDINDAASSSTGAHELVLRQNNKQY